jgi:hypothetical protein
VAPPFEPIEKPNTNLVPVQADSERMQCPAVMMMSGATKEPEQKAPADWSRKGSSWQRP